MKCTSSRMTRQPGRRCQRDWVSWPPGCLYFPDDLSLVPEPDSSRMMEGTDFIKVMLTSSPVDFSWLWNAGLRGTHGATALERLLRSLTGRGHRSIAVSHSAREDWTEETRVVLLQR